MEDRKKTVAIVPGSFDPITYGHIELVKEALAQFDLVYLAVMINPKKNYMFSLVQRTEIAKAALADLARVEVIASEGMLWKLAEELGATGIVKGYRNECDLAYEQEMATFNAKYNPTAKTYLVRSPASLEQLSSTAVREHILKGQSLEGAMPPKAIATIQKIISKRASF